MPIRRLADGMTGGVGLAFALSCGRPNKFGMTVPFIEGLSIN